MEEESQFSISRSIRSSASINLDDDKVGDRIRPSCHDADNTVWPSQTQCGEEYRLVRPICPRRVSDQSPYDWSGGCVRRRQEEHRPDSNSYRRSRSQPATFQAEHLVVHRQCASGQRQPFRMIKPTIFFLSHPSFEPRLPLCSYRCSARCSSLCLFL